MANFARLLAASRGSEPVRKTPKEGKLARCWSEGLIDGLRDLGAAARSDLRDLLIALGKWD